jgi:predicted phosphodiesterase
MTQPYKFSRRIFLEIICVAAVIFLFSPDLLAKRGEKPLLRFGMLSDVHYADREPSGNRFYRQSLSKVQEAIDLMNHEKVDFVIELGDFKDQDPVPNEANTLKYLTDIESVFRKFNGKTYHVLGNHDMDGISKKQFLDQVQNSRIPAAKTYYSFNRKGIHLVVLDGNFTKEGKEYDHGNFNWEDSSISPAQIYWLKKDLKSNRLPVIVFIHQMLDDSKGYKQSVQNAAEMRHILEQSGNLICVFQGHIHEERYNLINGIHYYSASAVVDGESPENNAYMIVEVYKNGNLKINGFRRASNREIRK